MRKSKVLKKWNVAGSRSLQFLKEHRFDNTNKPEPADKHLVRLIKADEEIARAYVREGSAYYNPIDALLFEIECFEILTKYTKKKKRVSKKKGSTWKEVRRQRTKYLSYVRQQDEL